MFSKILAAYFLFLVTIPFLATAEQKEPSTIKVDVSQICLRENGMYIIYNGCPFQVLSLKFENGEYIAETKQAVSEGIFGAWWCYNCQHYNSRFDSHCVYCGAPR